MNYVPHRQKDSPDRPSFRVRGWDSGSVHADIECVCGAEIFDDEHWDLAQTPIVRLECSRCHRVYVVTVACQLVLVPAAAQEDTE
jgi:hypothetical protein